jgi:hypothetical protein
MALSAIVATMAAPSIVADLALAAWSLVHGYATLCIEAAIEGAERRNDRAALFSRIIASSAHLSRRTM